MPNIDWREERRGALPGNRYVRVLRAFASGCSALTGVEAISNGIPAFKKPESRNAATTLVWMAGLLGVMFIGVSFLAHQYGITPRDNESVVSQIAAQVFGGKGAPYFIIQIATCLILILAANTSYADFPGSARSSRGTGFCLNSSSSAATASPSRSASPC